MAQFSSTATQEKILPFTYSDKFILGDQSTQTDLLTLRTKYNVVINKDEGDIKEPVLRQRPGFFYIPYAGNSTVSRVIIGGYYWNKTNRFYYIAYNPSGPSYALYSRELGTNSTSISTLTTVTVTDGVVPGWAEWEYNGTNYLVVLTGTEGWYINTSDVATQITDVDFPTPHCATPIVLDGYLFVAKKNTNDIYNADLGTVTTWTSTAFISTEIEAGSIKALAKQNQHLVAFTDTNIEFFRDAGTPAPNSPLARVETYNRKFAITNENVMHQFGQDVYFIGHTKEKLKPSVYTLSNFEVEEIGDEAVEITLRSFGSSQVYVISGYVATGYFTPEIDVALADTSTMTMVTVNGHKTLLIIPLGADKDTTTTASPMNAMAFSLDTKEWCFWGQPDPTATDTSVDYIDALTILSPQAVNFIDGSGVYNTALIAKVIYNNSGLDPLIRLNANISIDTTNYGNKLPITSLYKMGPYNLDTDRWKSVFTLWPSWKIQPLSQDVNLPTLTITAYESNDVSRSAVYSQTHNLNRNCYFTRLGRFKNLYLTMKLKSNVLADSNSFTGELGGFGVRYSVGSKY